MMLDQGKTCTQHILPLSTGISHRRSLSLVQAVNQLRTWSCSAAAAFFYLRTIISMSLIQTWGNQLKNVYEGVWLNCPHPPLMVCLCLIALQIPHCERSGWFSDYWSVLGISWSCSARAALSLWPGWAPASARLSSALPLKCQSWCCKQPVCLNSSGENRHSGGREVKWGLKCLAGGVHTLLCCWHQCKMGDAALTCLGWMQLQLKGAAPLKHHPFYLSGFLVLLSLAFLSLANYLAFLCLCDCEITGTILCT